MDRVIYKKRRSQASNLTKNILLRLFIFNRDNNRCVNCGSTYKLTIDHIISVYSGGVDAYDNFQTLCNKCNAGKAP
jgi:5-methylcytosine-specific restriction endonuclease McrA